MSPLRDNDHCESGKIFVVVREDSNRDSSLIIKSEGYDIIDDNPDDYDGSIDSSIECEILSLDTDDTTCTVDDDDDDNDDNNNRSSSSDNDNNKKRNLSSLLKQKIRKATVGVAGGTLVVLGVCLVPVPIPLSFLFIGSGLHVLGTEFDGIKHTEQKVVDTVDSVKEKLCMM